MKPSPLLLFTALAAPSLATLDYHGRETHRIVYDGGLYTSWNTINPEDHTYVNILPFIGGPKRVMNTDLVTKIGMSSTTSTSASSSTATSAVGELLFDGESSQGEEDERDVASSSSASVVTPAARVPSSVPTAKQSAALPAMTFRA